MALRLAPGIELEEQLIGELHGGVMAPGQRGHLRRLLQQPEPVHPGDRGRVVDLRPQVERPSIVHLRLDRRVGELGRLAGAHRCGERLGEPARGVPVVGQLAGRDRAVITERQFGVRREAHGDAMVQRAAPAREQVAVHRLVAERVAERVVVARRHHQLLAHRLPQRVVDRRVVGGHHVAKERIAHSTADDRSDPEHLAGGPVESGDALQEQVAHGGRQLLAAAGRHELLDEERVSLGASRDAPRQTRRRFLAEDQPDEVRRLVIGERDQRERERPP